MKKIIIIFCTILSIMLIGCSSADNSAEESLNESEIISENISKESFSPIENIYGKVINIEIKIKNIGVVTAELYPEEAPITVDNFIKKVKSGFYDGLVFHRVIKGFVVQAGLRDNGPSAESIKGEFIANGYNNKIPHERGVISMARKSSDFDSATSQFFICVSTEKETLSHLDGYYAAFGCVTSGMELIDLISVVTVDSNDRPVSDIIIEYIKITSEDTEESENISISDETNNSFEINVSDDFYESDDIPVSDSDFSETVDGESFSKSDD